MQGRFWIKVIEKALPVAAEGQQRSVVLFDILREIVGLILKKSPLEDKNIKPLYYANELK